MKLNSAKLECETVLKLSLATAEMNFVHAKLILFLAKLLHVGHFQFCSGGIDIHFDGEIQMEKV